MNIAKALNKPEKLKPEDKPLAEEMKAILAILMIPDIRF